MSNMIVDLGYKKEFINDDYSWKMTDLQNKLLMSIVDIPEKYVSYAENIIAMKVRTYFVKVSLHLFSWSTCSMYNRVDREQYIPGGDSWISVKGCYKKYYTENLSINYMVLWKTFTVYFHILIYQKSFMSRKK